MFGRIIQTGLAPNGDAEHPWDPEGVAEPDLLRPLSGLQNALGSRDPLAVSASIADLAVAVCVNPDLSEGCARLVRSASASGHHRLAVAIGHALGRCPKRPVLGPLLDLLRDTTLPEDVRSGLVISIAQRREPRLSHREGPGIQLRDTRLDSAIAEVDIRARLVELLRAAFSNEGATPARSTYVQALVLALGGSAAADPEVLSALRDAGDAHTKLLPHALMSMELSGGSEAVMTYAEEVLRRPGVPPVAVESAAKLLVRADAERGCDAIRGLLEWEGYPLESKVALMAGAAGMGRVSDVSVRSVEQLCSVASRLVETVPVISVPAATTAGPEGTATSGRSLPTSSALRPLLMAAMASAGSRSEIIPRLGARAWARWLSSEDGSGENAVRRLTTEQIANVGIAFALPLVHEMRAETIAPVLVDAALRSLREGLDAEDWAAVRRHADPLVHDLPPRMQEAWVDN